MLATTELITTIATYIKSKQLGNYVLDPVMVAKGGHRLLDPNAEKSIQDKLFL